MTFKCPGQDLRTLRVSVVKCPKCGTKVYRAQVPSCVDWCAHARECIGEERWRELRGED